MTDIGARMRKRRQELGLSGDYVGKMLGVDKTTIYRYEKGEIEKLPISIIKKLANILQTTPEYLMGWEKAQEAVLTDKHEQQVLIAFRKETENMTEDEKERFNNALSGLIKTASNIIKEQ